MEKKLKLPIGIENFEKLRMEGFYYIDKTGLITELLENLQHGARYAVWKRDSGHTFAELSASGTRGARNGQKENFCHGVLLGLLRYREDWLVNLPFAPGRIRLE